MSSVKSRIWIWSDKKLDWIAKEWVGNEDGANTKDGLYHCNEGVEIDQIPDLIKLVHLHEPAIYNALRMRYFADNI